MKDSSNPREGWRYDEYMKYATVAHMDEHGAVFFCLRDLLTKFCTLLKGKKISITLLNIDVRGLRGFFGDLKFDRIEVCIRLLLTSCIS